MSVGSMTAVERYPLRALLGVLAILVAVAAFNEPLAELVRRWARQEEYSHGFLIPLIVAWLLWTRRDAIVGSIGRPSWTGAVLILLAAAMHILGQLSALYLLSQLGFVIVLLGIVLGFGGYSLLRVTFVPLVFLVFAIPLPYFIDAVLSWRLQLISSELGVFFIRLFQIPVYLEGNVIDLGQYQLQVIEACSGLRYLYPLLSLGFLTAYLFHAPFWQRVLIFLLTIPITIVMNSVRIGMVGILVDRWGPQEADGLLHFFEGWIIFIACAALLIGAVYALARLGSNKRIFDVFYPPHVVAQGSPTATRSVAGYKPLVACLVLLCATGIAVTSVSGRTEIVPERTSFSIFPSTLGEWRGRLSSLEPQIEHALGLSDYILSDFSTGDARSINLYVAYYASQRQGLSPHSPSVCIPGNGWQITKFDRTNFGDQAHGLDFPFNRVVIERGSNKQIVYYWFEQRGRRIANEYWSKWYLLSDSIVKNRTDGALARLTTSVYPGETEADADSRLRRFARELMPTLALHLPPEAAPNIKRVLDRSHVNDS